MLRPIVVCIRCYICNISTKLYVILYTVIYYYHIIFRLCPFAIGSEEMINHSTMISPNELWILLTAMQAIKHSEYCREWSHCVISGLINSLMNRGKRTVAISKQVRNQQWWAWWMDGFITITNKKSEICCKYWRRKNYRTRRE